MRICSLFICLLWIGSAASDLLPREYQSEKAEVLGIESKLGGKVIKSSLGDFFVSHTDRLDQFYVRKILSKWEVGSFIDVWSSKQIESKVFALVHPNSSALFARKKPENIAFNTSIERFQMLGERCSGTNFLKGLLEHFSHIPLERKYGFKHFPIWFSHDSKWRADKSTLFIVIVRHPYDWLSSLNRIPWHADKSLYHLSFSDFIRKEWKISPDNPYEDPRRSDKDPVSGELFENAIQLRTAKTKDWLILQEHPNHFFINYETLRDYPYAVIAELADLFDLQIKGAFYPVKKYKNTGTTIYRKSVYAPISESDRNYIGEQLDPALEVELGYGAIFD